ncbi:hypothetical protein ACEQ8H_007298 [Pleosporales sp. CAS-2024a]
MASDHEDEDDDLYGTADTKQAQSKTAKGDADASSGDEPMDEDADSGDDDNDDEDSESDLEIIIDKPPMAPKPAIQHTSQESKAIKIEAPSQSTPAPSQAPKSMPTGTAPQLSSIPGTSYPAQKTSTMDVNGNPTYPPLSKPLLQVDLDADLADEQKIWRRPGEDQSDYFNYGFDEFTWETYRQRQLAMSTEIAQNQAQLKHMMQQMAGGPVPGPMPSAPPAAPPGNGMPGNAEQQQMEMMMQQMMAQGLDPGQMDFNSFMQMAGQAMPGFGPGVPGGPQGGGFQQGNQGGGRGGRGGRGRGW